MPSNLFPSHIITTLLLSISIPQTNAFQTLPTFTTPTTTTPHKSHLLVTQNNSPSSTSSPATLHALTFHNVSQSTNPTLLSEFLMELGATSTHITDHDRDTPQEKPLFNEPDPNDDDAALSWNDAATGRHVWNRCDVTGQFSSSFDLEGVVRSVKDAIVSDDDDEEEEREWKYSVEVIEDRDWVTHVQESWNPIVTDGFVLKFPWHDDDRVAAAVADDDDDASPDDLVLLELEGGVAFGTGEHPTTQLCLRWIKDVCRLPDGGGVSLLLDYGSGSGVLGIAACKCDPTLRAVGVDIDADAVRIADYNAERNGVAMKSYLPRYLSSSSGATGGEEGDSVLMKGRTRTSVESLPEELDGGIYDACVANILAQPLCGLVETIARMVKPGGGIGLSGILSYQADMVIDSYREYFDHVKVAEEREGWILITGTRK